MILVSAGFDIYMEDPLGGMNVTPEGFAGLTQSIMRMANECCGGKVVITLEGGYNLQGLRDSVKAVLRELAGLSKTSTRELLNKADQRAFDHVMNQVIDVQRRYWKRF
jgi:acetoin utilization deacetylase AcuC-like enzyme